MTACFFGDGAVAEGEFHESLNLAALWKLPVLFLCENNLYAMGTRIERARRRLDLAAKARTYGMPAESVDGMDVLAVEEAARSAVRAVSGPDAVRTFSRPDLPLPRAFDVRRRAVSRQGGSREWKKRDPIVLLAAHTKRAPARSTPHLRCARCGRRGGDRATPSRLPRQARGNRSSSLTRDVYTPAGRR